MKIVAVVGSGSGCGKTTFICRILRAIPGLGAVKISPREDASRVEWGRGKPGKDTDHFVDSGAACVARIIGPRNSVVRSWGQIRDSFETCPAVVVEGTRSLDFPGKLLVVFVEGGRSGEFRKKRTSNFYRISTLHIDNSSHKDNKYDLKYFYAPHNINSSDQEETIRNPKIPISESEALEIIRGFISI